MRESVLKHKKQTRLKRKKRIRAKISGTSETPRVSIFKSNKHFYAQAIDDTKGHTIASVDGCKEKEKCSIEGVKNLGKILADSLKEAGITEVVFDRNGYLYHGVVKSFADTIRENGIKL